MELKVKLEIENLYGGDGFKRPEEREIIKYSVKKTKETERYENMIFDDKIETVKEKQIIEIESFKKDEKERYSQRLGGSHGKIWGSLKAVGKFLVDCKNPIFLSLGIKSLAAIDRMMNTINMTPVYPELSYEKIWIDTIPQKLNGFGNKMIFIEYDVITKVQCEMTLIFPDVYYKPILEMLKAQEMIPTLNKRRSSIKIMNKEIFS